MDPEHRLNAQLMAGSEVQWSPPVLTFQSLPAAELMLRGQCHGDEFYSVAHEGLKNLAVLRSFTGFQWSWDDVYSSFDEIPGVWLDFDQGSQVQTCRVNK
jgi:hypothetical protein